jgi:hypothetical protein
LLPAGWAVVRGTSSRQLRLSSVRMCRVVQTIEQPGNCGRMPRVTPRSPNTPGLQLVGNAPHRCNPRLLNVIHDAQQVGGVLGSLGFDDATASALPTCLPRSARAPLGLPSFTAAAAKEIIEPLLVTTALITFGVSISNSFASQEPEHQMARPRWAAYIRARDDRHGAADFAIGEGFWYSTLCALMPRLQPQPGAPSAL